MSIINSIVAYFFPKRAIGPFNATVTIEEIAVDELEITKHPVQQGAEITDHAFKKPTTITMSVQFGGLFNPVEETYQNFLDLQETLVPFTVITKKRTYPNMLIASMVETTDADSENILNLQLELQEIIITNIVTTTIVPERSKQANPGATGATENAGQKNAQQLSPEEQNTALKNLANAGGNIRDVFFPGGN